MIPCRTFRRSPIIGASRLEQLEPVLAAVDTSLPQEVIERLDAISRKHRAGDAVV